MSIRDISSGLQHIGLPTKDIEKTEEYYLKIGFTVLLRGVVPSSGDKVVFLQLGNLVIEAYESDETAGVSGAIDHIAINVDDVHEAWRYIEEIGLNNSDPIDFLPFFKNGVKFFIITGPNGERIEFNQYL